MMASKKIRIISSIPLALCLMLHPGCSEDQEALDPVEADRSSTQEQDPVVQKPELEPQPKQEKHIVEEMAEDLFVIAVKDRYGYINRKGEVVIEPQFGFATTFSEGKAIAMVVHDLGNGSLRAAYSYINPKGEILFEHKYPFAHIFSEGLAQVMQARSVEGKLKQLTGFVDRTGRVAIPLKFDYVRGINCTFQDGLACVCLDGKWGCIDHEGAFVIDPKYDEYFTFSENLAPVGIDGKYGYIDRAGKEIIKPVYADGEGFSEGLAWVKKDGLWGCIDREGKMAIEPAFDQGFPFSEGLAQVERDGKQGYVNQKGETVIPLAYEKTQPLSQGLACVKKDAKWGCLDREGKEVIPPTYALEPWDYLHFSEGLARVKIGDKYGYIDTTGKTAIEPRFHMAYDFNRGLAVVTIMEPVKGGEMEKDGYIDKTGNFVWEPSGKFQFKMR
jgi:hypothetical protein